MNLVRIDKLFKFEKGSLQSSKCTSGKYNFITASAEWKTHNEFSHDTEALVFAAAAAGSLGRTHYVNGKFIASDLCFILSPRDPINIPVDLQFYHIIFNELREDIVKNTKSGTSKEAIGLTSFGKYEIPYFEIVKQSGIKERFVRSEGIKEKLSFEFSRQLDLLKKLRQQILQDAVQGKLVPQDPNDEPASRLFERIKTEKENLIRVKKIKKEKLLPEIKREEIPFEIPENWVWCRLNDICEQIVDCPHSTPKYLDFNTGFYGIDTNCITESGSIVYLRPLSEESYMQRVQRLIPQANDIVYAREGSIGLSTFIPDREKICLGQRVMLFRPSTQLSPLFLKYAVTEENYKNRLLEKHRGMGAKHVNVKDIVRSVIGLPPISEQHRIVTKIEQLMKLCDELEQTIQQNQKYTKELLDVALREALEPGNVIKD